MRFTRRGLTIAGAAALASVAVSARPGSAAGPEAAAVAVDVKALRRAMLTAEKASLAALAHEKLSYAHSSGKTQNRAEYSDASAAKTTVFKTISLTDPTTAAVVGNNAIVWHTFAAELDRSGRADAVKIDVPQVWAKQDGKWLLLARQGYEL